MDRASNEANPDRLVVVGLHCLTMPLMKIEWLRLTIGCLLLVLCFSEQATSQTQGTYPYPAANRSRWQAPRTARRLIPTPQSTGSSQAMPVPFSGQSFGPSNLNSNGAAGFQPPAGLIGPANQTLGNPPAQLQIPNFGGTPANGLAGPSGTPQPGVFAPVPGANPNFVVPNGPQALDLDVYIPQGPTSRLSLGATFNSDSELIGKLIFDERDFNLRAFPRSLRDLGDPRLFKGGGQTLRVEVVPGSDLERYVVNFGDPYFLNTDYSLSVSGYYFDRQYFDWDEQRAGGKVAIGRKLTNYLSWNLGLRLEDVRVDNPRLGGSPSLNAVLGSSDFYQFHVGLVYDTRQSPFLIDSGSYLALTFKQAFGEFDYSSGEIDYRYQRLLFQNTPTSGHHIVSFRTRLGISGSDSPVFENYFAGGLFDLRGFDFRGVSPIENGVRVGGRLQWVNTLEYQFPITTDDMISAVTFIDFGTVESDIEINSENFRVAPGFGFRVQLPFAGMAAPLSFDFAFPVSEATGDEKRSFSFSVGGVR